MTTRRMLIGSGLGLAALVLLGVVLAIVTWPRPKFIVRAIAAAMEKDPFKRAAATSHVAWLEKVAGSRAEAQKLVEVERLYQSSSGLRIAAYARLGALGTPKSLAAVKRVEDRAKGQPLTPDPLPLDVWPSASWHCNDIDAEMPLAQVSTAGRLTYAVIRNLQLGGHALIWTKTPDNPASWSRPRPLPREPENLSSARDLSLAIKDQDTLALSYVVDSAGKKKIPVRCLLSISISVVSKDADGDGWTDSEERRLGLNPNKADTDGDGISDGMDPCPNYAPSKAEAQSDETLILQKALFALYGLTDSREILAGDSSQKVQVWGYRGVILYTKASRESNKEDGLDSLSVSWSVTRQGDTAEAWIGDYIGPLAFGSQKFTLKKIDGTWYVTQREFGPVG